MLLGKVDGNVRRTAGTNASTIVVTRVGEVWQTSGFDVSVDDEQGQRWIISLPASEWH